jgi:hypothetical protein
METSRPPIRFLKKADFKYMQELRKLDFSRTVKSSYAPQRLEVWYGFGSNLRSIKDGSVEVEWKQDLPKWLKELKEQYMPEANSVLICKGKRPESDTSIDWHRDHGTFEKRVVMINYGYTLFYLQDYNEGTIVHTLTDGDVVDFDSKLLHKSTQTCDERYIITFRKLKIEFSSQKLF